MRAMRGEAEHRDVVGLSIFNHLKTGMCNCALWLSTSRRTRHCSGGLAYYVMKCFMYLIKSVRVVRHPTSGFRVAGGHTTRRSS